MEELTEMVPGLTEPQKNEIVRAVQILSNETKVSEDKIYKLCVLSSGMGGLYPYGVGETGCDYEGVMGFLRGLYRTRKFYS